MAVKKDLTEKQKAFVEAYMGNGVEAARAAGYAGSYDTLGATASRLLKDHRIKKAIEAKSDTPSSKGKNVRAELEDFFRNTMTNEVHGIKDRLRAAELLGKLEGLFIEKREHSVDERLGDILEKSWQ